MAQADYLQPFRRALASLHELDGLPVNPIVRDAVIQRFEYTFEAAWKALRRTLSQRGIVVNSPREVIRQAGKETLIGSVDDWLSYLECRNLTVHTYNEDVAKEVYLAATGFPRDADALLRILEDALADSASD